MEAIVSDKQCGYYVKLVIFILELGMKVLHTYFEQNILNAKDHLELYMFLEGNKHNLFHECYPRVKCCKCSQNCRAPPSKKGGLHKDQFMLLFECGPLIEIDHYKTGNHNEITKECLCRIMAKKSNDVDCMDITLMYAIIQSCCFKNSTVIHGNPRCIEVIKKTRNFLAHVPNACISKTEFDTRFAETEQAILEIGSSLGKYFAKENKKEVDSFKANELSIEVIKRIIKTNVDETITKKLRTIIEDERKYIVQIKDEIIDHLKQYKDELSIDFKKLRLEVRQYASCSTEERFHNSAGSVSKMNVAAGGPATQIMEKDNSVQKVRVEWRLETPNTWNLPQIKETLEKFSSLLRQWFEIEFVYVGSLVLSTLVNKNVLDNPDQMRTSIQLFLEKVVELCNINTDVPTVVKIDLIIKPDELVYRENDTETTTSKLDIKKKDKITCIYCNLSFECQKCQQKDEIIERLTEEISESEAVIICENCKKNDYIIAGLKDKLYEMSKTDISENNDDTKKAQVAIAIPRVRTSTSVVFREPLEDKTCFEGDTISLECVIDGEKKPIKWYKDKKDVCKLSDNLRDESTDQTCKLTILHATRDDAGVYTMWIGNESKNVRLNVFERPPSFTKLRSYQQELAAIALKGENTIICAGQNAGKTYVAFHVIESHLLNHPRGKVVFINKTNVLLSQQYQRACETFTTLHFQGKIKIWKANEDDSGNFKTEIAKARLIFLTPKSLCNHLMKNATSKVSIDIFTLIIIDECHSTHDKSVYNELMSYYRIAKYREETHRLPQILGLTASIDTYNAKDLSAAKDHLRKVMANLDVTKISVVHRHREELLQYTSIPEKVTIASFIGKRDLVKDILIEAMQYVENKLNSRIVSNFLIENLQIERDLYEALNNPPIQRAEVRYIHWIGETKEKVEHVLHKDTKVPRLLHACLRHLEIYTECLEINSLLEIDQVCEIVMQRYSDESEASQNANTNEEKEIISKLRDVFAGIRESVRDIERNPDVNMVIDLIKKEYQLLKEDSRFIIFVKTGATAKALAERLPGYLRSTYLTGSHRLVEEGGLPANEQIGVLEKFKNGEHLCIVAASVACEGLDIPQCNMMIRYRFSADEISSLQMRGRLRNKEGREFRVSTIPGFETEKKNIQSQYLMTQAIDQVSKLNMTKDIAIAEKMVYEIEEIERKRANMRLNQKIKGLFTINCKYCGVFITDGDSMRQVNEKLFLVCDRSMLARVDMRQIPKKKQREFDGIKKLGKAYGLECGHNWGSIVIYNECEFVALSQHYMKIFDRQADSFINCEKWNDLKFKIEEISDEDFMNYNR
ncbi:antiviral innate immune response receptor RIG-I-like [Mytilus trossulus]|uniref:antiviral innate immune response receptor RIG-I-like n=1 Tax=Mytilus trossulus TaxID=6551 RepID=UPI00300442C6